MDLKELFERAGLSARVSSLVLDELEAGNTGGDLKLMIRRSEGSPGVAVRSEDIPLLETAVHTVSTMISATMLTGWAPGLVASLVILLYKFYKNRINLSAEQAKLVFELRQNPGATNAELALVTGLDIDHLLTQLSELKEVRKASGARADLVEQNAEGRWFLADI